MWIPKELIAAVAVVAFYAVAVLIGFAFGRDVGRGEGLTWKAQERAKGDEWRSRYESLREAVQDCAQQAV